MFLDFFHLHQQPFGVTPDPAFLYPSGTHCEALDSLTEGILEGRGFLALIAEPGMGKTTLLYQVLEGLRGYGAGRVPVPDAVQLPRIFPIPSERARRRFDGHGTGGHAHQVK